MKVLITGASGFLGRYVVAAALEQGHTVTALIRPATNETTLSWYQHPAVKLVRLDLRQPKGLVETLQDIEAVIHLAATKAGDFYTQFAGTVIATENLLQAMEKAQVQKLVAVSTFSVYDYRKLGFNRVLDETSALESQPQHRDEYAQTKLIQEQLVRSFAHEHTTAVVIIRPGMIYGREDLWHALVGQQMGNRWFCIAPHAVMPLTYVENCAEAIVAALDSPGAIGQTLNIVDDALPTRKAYVQALLKQTDERPGIIPISWFCISACANLAWFVNQQFFRGRAKLPGILVPAKLQARFKPLRDNNLRAQEILNWQPSYSLTEAISRSLHGNF
jgi:nucleoside-diphosphate-sugar epimerase